MTNDETNSKLEVRNSKQARNPKFECSKHASVFLDFEFYSFGVVSDFDIRISDLRPTFVLCHFPVTQALMPAQSQRYFPFSKTITVVVIQANVRSQTGETNSPIFRRSLVNRTSGMTAKESCRLRMTWLSKSNFAVPLAPNRAATITAGIIAMRRVIKRRSHGRKRMLRKPSITIWPASVPVRVEFCPEARRAKAKSTLAIGTPSVGERSL